MSGKKTILVTGGAGYIGSHTVVELIENNYRPVIVDDFRNSSPDVVHGIESITGVTPEIISIDVCNKALLREVFETYTFDGIIHFAAYKAVGESVKEPLKYYRNNIDSLINCLELAQEFKVPNFVFSSSCTVYGEPDTESVTELSAVKKANAPYGETKQICEQIINDVVAGGNNTTRFLVLRYFNPVGAHHSARIGELPIGKPNNLLPFVTQTAAGWHEQLTVFGNDYATPDGTCIRDYIHVVDLADAHVKGLEFIANKSANSVEIFNVGTGNGVSVLEIIHTFEKVSGKSLNWKFGPRRPGDVEKIFADTTKIENELQWRATKSTEDAVLDAWNWQKTLNND